MLIKMKNTTLCNILLNYNLLSVSAYFQQGKLIGIFDFFPLGSSQYFTQCQFQTQIGILMVHNLYGFFLLVTWSERENILKVKEDNY